MILHLYSNPVSARLASEQVVSPWAFTFILHWEVAVSADNHFDLMLLEKLAHVHPKNKKGVGFEPAG
jgi:hypothetical protein